MQLSKWDIDVAGRSYAVSVERGENGKDVVRVDGRIATRPIAQEEVERSITIAGAPFLLRRRGTGAYDLVPAATVAAEQNAVLAVLGQNDVRVALKPDSLFQRLPLFAWVAIVAVVGAMILFLAWGPSYKKVALARVDRVLGEMHADKNSQFAVTFWYKNKKILPLAEMSIGSNAFDKWRQSKDLYRKVGDYTVLDANVVDGAAVPTAIVRFTLEGTEYRVRVPKDLPISWEE